jgi:kelch-like protein 10
MRAFNPVTRRWLHMNTMSVKRCYVSAVVLDGYIYALGGCDGPHRVETVERYNVATNIWSRCPSMLSRRSDAGACALNGKIYVCGGFTGDEVLNS